MLNLRIVVGLTVVDTFFTYRAVNLYAKVAVAGDELSVSKLNDGRGAGFDQDS